MKIEGRQSRSQVARSATDRSVAEQVIEVYNALAEVYADQYESGNRDRPFLDAFRSHLRGGARLLDWAAEQVVEQSISSITACV